MQVKYDRLRNVYMLMFGDSYTSIDGKNYWSKEDLLKVLASKGMQWNADDSVSVDKSNATHAVIRLDTGDEVYRGSHEDCMCYWGLSPEFTIKSL